MKKVMMNLVILAMTFIGGTYLCRLVIKFNQIEGDKPDVIAPIAQSTVSQIQTPLVDKINNGDTEGKLLEEEKIRYKDFQIIRQVREGYYKEPSQKLNKPFLERHHYIKIKKNGKTIKDWDGWSWFTSEIKLLSFVNKKTKELWIKLDGNRLTVDLVITLEDEPRLIFDSLNTYKSEVQGGDPVDVDGDGVYEFDESIEVFGCSIMACAFTPQGKAIFKYDAKEKKFLLANRESESYLLKTLQKDLRTVERTITNLKTAKDKDSDQYNSFETDHESSVLKLILDSIYAGKEKEAWELYEKMYQLPNKEEVKRLAKEMIKGDDIYKQIYK